MQKPEEPSETSTRAERTVLQWVEAFEAGLATREQLQVIPWGKWHEAHEIELAKREAIDEEGNVAADESAVKAAKILRQWALSTSVENWARHNEQACNEAAREIERAEREIEKTRSFMPLRQGLNLTVRE